MRWPNKNWTDLTKVVPPLKTIEFNSMHKFPITRQLTTQPCIKSTLTYLTPINQHINQIFISHKSPKKKFHTYPKKNHISSRISPRTPSKNEPRPEPIRLYTPTPFQSRVTNKQQPKSRQETCVCRAQVSFDRVGRLRRYGAERVTSARNCGKRRQVLHATCYNTYRLDFMVIFLCWLLLMAMVLLPVR